MISIDRRNGAANVAPFSLSGGACRAISFYLFGGCRDFCGGRECVPGCLHEILLLTNKTPDKSDVFCVFIKGKREVAFYSIVTQV